jgi:hypothetical protein
MHGMQGYTANTKPDKKPPVIIESMEGIGSAVSMARLQDEVRAPECVLNITCPFHMPSPNQARSMYLRLGAYEESLRKRTHTYTCAKTHTDCQTRRGVRVRPGRLRLQLCRRDWQPLHKQNTVRNRAATALRAHVWSGLQRSAASQLGQVSAMNMTAPHVLSNTF